MDIIRHGDVTLVPCEVPVEAKNEFTGKNFTAQEGETTGHKHMITATKPFTVSTVGIERFFAFPEAVVITHEEHKKLVIPPGTYKQLQEREKDWFILSVRQVID